MVVAVGYIEIAFVHGHAVRSPQVHASDTIAHDGREGLGLGVVDANEVVNVVGDVDEPIGANVEVLRAVHAGFEGLAILLALVAASQRGDAALLVDVAQSVAAALQEINTAIRREVRSARVDKRTFGGEGSVLGHAPFAVASDGGDSVGLEIEEADAAVLDVGDQELVAGTVKGDADDLGVERLGDRATVAGKAGFATGIGVDGLGFGVVNADASIEVVGEQAASLSVNGDVMHVFETGLQSGATVTTEPALASARDVGELAIGEAMDACAVVLHDDHAAVGIKGDMKGLIKRAWRVFALAARAGIGDANDQFCGVRKEEGAEKNEQ